MNVKPALSATLAAFVLLACSPGPQMQSTPSPVAEEKVAASEMELGTETVLEDTGVPAMWKVADEDTTIYIFGTVHTLPDNVEWKTDAVANAIAASGSLVTEIDMTPEAAASIGAFMQAEGMLPPGQTLRGLMDDEQTAVYEAGLAKIGIPAAAFDTMEPWLASIAILQIVTQAGGYNEGNGVETVLEASISEGTERIALETVQFQISIFDELPMEEQLAYLLEGAEDPTAGIETLNEIVDVWASGSPEKLGELMNEGFADHPNLGERLLYERNAKWAEWIDARLDSPGTVFMAVGAGHLGGDRSVQDYLEEKGIAATRVQ